MNRISLRALRARIHFQIHWCLCCTSRGGIIMVAERKRPPPGRAHRPLPCHTLTLHFLLNHPLCVNLEENLRKSECFLAKECDSVNRKLLFTTEAQRKVATERIVANFLICGNKLIECFGIAVLKCCVYHVFQHTCYAHVVVLDYNKGKLTVSPFFTYC